MSALNKTYNLDAIGEKGTIEAQWSGKIKSTYVSFFDGKAYDCMSLSDAPTMKVTASGMKEDRSNVSIPVQGVTILDNNMGYRIDRAALASYMNDNNMAQIRLQFVLTFPSASTKEKNTFTATTTIRRKAFCVDSVFATVLKFRSLRLFSLSQDLEAA